MSITKAGNVITISTDGVGTTGSTLVLAYVMQDVYNADVAGGWGAIHKQGANQWKIDCDIIVGGQTLATYLKFIKEDILFCGELFQIGGGTMPWHYYPGRVYLGELTNGESVNGSTFTFGYAGAAAETKLYNKAETLYLYNSQIKTISAISSKIQISNAGPLVLNRAIIDGITSPFYEVVSTWKMDADDSVIQNANIGVYMEDAAKRMVFNGLIFKNCNTGIYNFGMGGTTFLLNMKTKNTPLLVDIDTSGWILRFVNPDIETWHVNIRYANNYVYRVYSVDLKIVDSNNVVIAGVSTRVWDLASAIVIAMNTEVSGKLIDSGTATSGSNTSLFDTSKSWTTDTFKRYLIEITAGTGISQIRGIEGNTATEIKIGSGNLNNWKTNPDNTSVYKILPTLEYGYLSQGNGDNFTMKTPHTLKMYKYGKQMHKGKFEITAKTDWVLTMYDNDYITEATEATVAAYTGIAINHTTGTITISENHTIAEIYDYLQYDIKTNPQLAIDETISTADGVNFTSQYDFVVNTGITVTATDKKLSMIAGKSYTLTGTAQFTGIIATTTTTRVPVVLVGIKDGSRYRIEKTSDGSLIAEGTQSGVGDITNYYEHTADMPITLRIRKSSSSPKYLPYTTSGTIEDIKFVLTISQIEDDIAS